MQVTFSAEMSSTTLLETILDFSPFCNALALTGSTRSPKLLKCPYKLFSDTR